MKKKPKILIGYDGSKCADAALFDLTHAGLPPNAEVLILSIADTCPAPATPPKSKIDNQTEITKSSGPGLTTDCAGARAALALVGVARDWVQANFPNWKVTAKSYCGSPAGKLIAEANEWEPDLIVVGSHGRTGFGRLVLGSVSQRVLTEAHCSVRIAHGPMNKRESPLRIIIGIDGSPASLDAVKEVASRTWPPLTEAKVMVVDSPLFPEYLGLIPPLGKILAEDKQNECAWVEKISTQPIAFLHAAGVEVSSVLRNGEPKKELPKAAEEWNAHCIFLGSTGFNNRIERFVLGSVSATVAARASCSVEVVRSKPIHR